MIDQFIKDRYFYLLKNHITNPQEKHLAAAAELGMDLALAGAPDEEVAGIHEEVLLRLSREFPDMRLLATAHLISAPLTEMLMAYGIAFRQRLEERKSAEEEVRHLAKELAALNSLGRKVTATLSLDEVVEAALDEILTVIQPDLELIFLREDSNLLLRGVRTKSPEFSHRVTPKHVVGECLCGLAVSEGKPIYSKNIHKDLRCAWEECKKAGLISFAALPLFSRDEIIGVVALASGVERDFEKQTEFLEALSSKIAMGLQNALFYLQVQRHAAELEQRVEDRAKELRDAQDELVRREKLATLGQLAGSVSHELRNPLGVIGNSVYYLKMKFRDADADKMMMKHLDILQREVERSNKLISTLLDFSIARPPSLVEGDLNSVVKETLAGIEIPENITVETQLDKDLPAILFDPDQIRQVFQNLISNSIHAMPEGSRLTIKTWSKGDFVDIMFSDTGEGISEENLPKIFEPLFTTKAKGIGLGIAIVKGIVDSHKGSIEVESAVGEGTTFYVKLPRGLTIDE